MSFLQSSTQFMNDNHIQEIIIPTPAPAFNLVSLGLNAEFDFVESIIRIPYVHEVTPVPTVFHVIEDEPDYCSATLSTFDVFPSPNPFFNVYYNTSHTTWATIIREHMD